MRVLWIKVGGLWPTNTGGRLRTFQILSNLSAGHEVTLVTTHGSDAEREALAAALPHVETVVSVPFTAPKQGTAAFASSVARSWMSREPVDLWRWRVPAVRRAAASAVRDAAWDVVVSDFLVAAANVPPLGRTPLVYFAHNVEHQIWKRLASVESARWKRAALEIEWRKVRSREAALVRRAALTIAVSDVDREQLGGLVPDAEIQVVPTGVDVDYFRPDASAPVPQRLVFSGSMDWYPNEDAMLDFVEHAWPRLRALRTGVTLTIVGRRPSERVLALGRIPGITVTGTVQDVRPHLRDGEVYIVPLRVGGGTRLKILEALAAGKPVVSTTVGAEGLDLVDGRHLVIADGHDAFVAAIARLLDDAPRRAALGEAGRELVASEFSWPQVTRHFAGALARAAGRPRAVVPMTSADAARHHPTSPAA